MKNYAGHRLSPWLGHLMVSRQETARPLLTPGEVMQLPPADEIGLVSGMPPIRAKKARYLRGSRASRSASCRRRHLRRHTRMRRQRPTIGARCSLRGRRAESAGRESTQAR